MSDVHIDRLYACPECDALQVLPEAPHAGRIVCWRCGTWLAAGHRDRLDQVFALALAAMVLFLIVNAAALIQLNLQGEVVTTTIAGAAEAFWSLGVEPISILVLTTAVIFPGIYLAAVLYLTGGLLWIERSAKPRDLPYALLALHMTQHAQSWSMLEVFLMGALVSVVRLQPVSVVVPGAALWALGALVLLFATLTTTFHPRELWPRLERAAASS